MKEGRPKGTTDVIRKLISDLVVTANENITDVYAVTRGKAGANKVEDNTL